jgi:hypothetical protein
LNERTSKNHLRDGDLNERWKETQLEDVVWSERRSKTQLKDVVWSERWSERQLEDVLQTKDEKKQDSKMFCRPKGKEETRASSSLRSCCLNLSGVGKKGLFIWLPFGGEGRV